MPSAGGDLLFRGFADQSGSGTAGATAIDPLSISVTPLPGLTGLRFAVTQNAVSGQLLEAFFRFTADNGPYTGSTLTLAGAGATVDGVVNGVFEGCGAANFSGPGGSCGGAPVSLIVTQADGFSILTDSIDFAPQSFFDVFVTLRLDGGLAGTASGATLDVTFANVPEPATAYLGAGALAMLFLHARRKAACRKS